MHGIQKKLKKERTHQTYNTSSVGLNRSNTPLLYLNCRMEERKKMIK